MLHTLQSYETDWSIRHTESLGQMSNRKGLDQRVSVEVCCGSWWSSVSASCVIAVTRYRAKPLEEEEEKEGERRKRKRKWKWCFLSVHSPSWWKGRQGVQEAVVTFRKSHSVGHIQEEAVTPWPHSGRWEMKVQLPFSLPRSRLHPIHIQGDSSCLN